jgi:hypothetical protein
MPKKPSVETPTAPVTETISGQTAPQVTTPEEAIPSTITPTTNPTPSPERLERLRDRLKTKYH